MDVKGCIWAQEHLYILPFLIKPAFGVTLLRASRNSTNRSLVGREQDGQCTYNLTLRRVNVTIVTVEKQ